MHPTRTARPLWTLLPLLLVALVACERGEATTTTTPNGSRLVLPAGVDPIEFETGTVRIVAGEDTIPLVVEIAETTDQRARGLMYRTRMPADAGMIFLYPEGSTSGFWMFNTRIPLSIAYADRRGRILRILDMEPCESSIAGRCPSYPPGVEYHAALEVNQGFFEANGVRAGHYFLFERDGAGAAN